MHFKRKYVVIALIICLLTCGSAVRANDIFSAISNPTTPVVHSHISQNGLYTDEQDFGQAHTAGASGNTVPGSPAEQGLKGTSWKFKSLQGDLDVLGTQVDPTSGPIFGPCVLPTYKFNCVSSAFSDSLSWNGGQGGGTDDIGKCVWIATTEVQKILDGRYRPLGPTERAQPCDVVVYYGRDGSIQHLGHVREVDANGNVTKVRSKDGAGPAWDHTRDGNFITDKYVNSGKGPQPGQSKVFRKTS